MENEPAGSTRDGAANNRSSRPHRDSSDEKIRNPNRVTVYAESTLKAKFFIVIRRCERRRPSLALSSKRVRSNINGRLMTELIDSINRFEAR